MPLNSKAHLRKLKVLKLTGCFLLLFLKIIPSIYASDGNNMALIFRGVARTLFSAVEIPCAILQNSSRTPFPFNIVTGTVAGAFRTVAGTVGGVADMARGAAPYAKYAALAL